MARAAACLCLTFPNVNVIWGSRDSIWGVHRGAAPHIQLHGMFKPMWQEVVAKACTGSSIAPESPSSRVIGVADTQGTQQTGTGTQT